MAAHADGGRLRFSKKDGPFLITLFTAPEPLVTGPADFSVMVQDADGAVVPKADITIRLENVATHAEVIAQANSATASNKLLKAAEFRFPSAGTWRVYIAVRDGRRHGECDSTVDVTSGSGRRALVWSFALLPLIVILLFLLHQAQKDRLQQRRAS